MPQCPLAGDANEFVFTMVIEVHYLTTTEPLMLAASIAHISSVIFVLIYFSVLVLVLVFQLFLVLVSF